MKVINSELFLIFSKKDYLFLGYAFFIFSVKLFLYKKLAYSDIPKNLIFQKYPSSFQFDKYDLYLDTSLIRLSQLLKLTENFNDKEIDDIKKFFLLFNKCLLSCITTDDESDEIFEEEFYKKHQSIILKQLTKENININQKVSDLLYDIAEQLKEINILSSLNSYFFQYSNSNKKNSKFERYIAKFIIEEKNTIITLFPLFNQKKYPFDKVKEIANLVYIVTKREE